MLCALDGKAADEYNDNRKRGSDMTQNERLDYLLDAFRLDAGEDWDFPAPKNTEEKRRLLRGMMNVRMPRPMAEETLAVQDAYLLRRCEERGPVRVEEIPSVRDLGGTQPEDERMALWQGDITLLAADAIVNAANSQMLGCFVPCHSCIDNCIHTYAGVQLRADCDRQMEALRRRYGRNYEQPTAVPMLTPGYNLPAKHVIHIVGPIVEERLTLKLEADLAACYRNTLDLCEEKGLHSVAFCCISTGVFRFPKERAAEIAVSTVRAWLAEYAGPLERIIFTVHGEQNRRIYEQNLYGRD